MTDNEIIKALECCRNSRNFEDCNECAFVECMTDKGCLGELLTDTLDLINRQKAEIERLQYCNETNISSIATLHQQLKTPRAKAITEFAERLKKKSEIVYGDRAVCVDFVDEIAKEMKGEQ